MKKIMCVTALIAAALLGTAGCSATSDASPAGTWGDPSVKSEPSLKFQGSASKGDYSGTDGCNVIGGSYTVDGDTIDLGVMVSTMMFCEGIDTWLSQARTASLDGDTLTLFDEQGDEIGALERND